MEGSFERQIEDKIMGKVDERVNDKVNELYGKIDGLKARFTGYLIITGLVASLIGAGSGYLLHQNLENKVRNLEDKNKIVETQSIMSKMDYGMKYQNF